MTQGTGKYDRCCTRILREEKADAVIVIVRNGRSGSGYAAQFMPALGATAAATASMMESQIRVLRQVADSLEADAANLIMKDCADGIAEDERKRGN